MKSFRNIVVAVSLLLILPSVTFAGTAPTASIVIPTGNILTPQNQAVLFSGSGAVTTATIAPFCPASTVLAANGVNCGGVGNITTLVARAECDVSGKFIYGVLQGNYGGCNGTNPVTKSTDLSPYMWTSNTTPWLSCSGTSCTVDQGSTATWARLTFTIPAGQTAGSGVANTVNAYEWRENSCSTGTLLSSSSSFSLSTPSTGTRVVYLRVQDSQGLWSTNCPSVTLTIMPPPTASITTPTGATSVATGTAVPFAGTGAGLNLIVGNYPVSSPGGSAYDPYTNSIWVANYGATTNSVTKLNASTGAVSGTYVVGASGSYPKRIAFDSLTNSIWVILSNSLSGNVIKLNPTTGAIIGTYTVGTGVSPTWSSPSDVVFDSSTNSVWVTQSSAYSGTVYPYNALTKFNASTGAVIGAYFPVTAGTYAGGAEVFDSSTGSIWLVKPMSNTITKLNVSTGAVIGTYTTGTAPVAAAFDSFTNSIWVANYSSNTVTKFNTSNGSVVGTYSVGTNPFGVAFDSITNSVWVTNYNSNSITKLNASTGATIGTYSLTAYSYPSYIAFDPSTSSLWVDNYNAGWVVSKLRASGPTTITAYDWHLNTCATGALLNSNSSFNFATSTAGTYSIYFRVQDSVGSWSTNCPSQSVTVNPSCVNGAVNYPTCTTNAGGSCINGTNNPPTCNTCAAGFTFFNNACYSCTNGAVNYPTCTTNASGLCINGANNPAVCSICPAGQSFDVSGNCVAATGTCTTNADCTVPGQICNTATTPHVCVNKPKTLFWQF